MNMPILEDVDLQAFNTLALPARARHFIRIENYTQLRESVSWAQQHDLPLLVLGGGSNVVLRGDWPGLVLQIALPGKFVELFDDCAEITVGAGENWHELVQWTLQQNLYGLENLTLIPGTVGAAPIQNIGAYGVELAEFVHVVRGYSLDQQRSVELNAAECRLGYRDSIFKHELRDRFIITAVVLRLRTEFVPVLSYPALQQQLQGREVVSAVEVEQAVRAIRQSKLPNPTLLPNAGSFFKNPVITHDRLAELMQSYADIPHFPAPGGDAKVPAAWLVDRCGWKGKRNGHVGIHDQQALVMINYGAGTGAELLGLAQQVRDDVLDRFDIELELEPTVYGA
jgi:UDP-N-acetylmuramate dehydrogenase